KYEFIDGEKAHFPISRMCAWLDVSTSGFHAWRTRPTSAVTERRQELKLIIRHIFEDSDGTYGYRRIHAALSRLDIVVGPELVRALMRELGLVPCQPRPWRRPPSRPACDRALPHPRRPATPSLGTGRSFAPVGVDA
ncbi:IS3 family transposase, partial [Actinacidiphila oryziradicis]|uniref:IS3 family transposase n=1 Tax=Actinacidiphila oryziradicis TaxID=2571141 RepID=UPI0023EF9E04